MEKIKQQILFDPEAFFWLREEQIGRRQKNLSRTVNELIKNYRFMIKRMEELHNKQDSDRQEVVTAQETAQDYRKQVVKPNQPMPDIKEWLSNYQATKPVKEQLKKEVKK